MSDPSPPRPATTYPVASLERRFYAFALDRLLAVVLAAAVGALAWVVTDGEAAPTAASAAGALVAWWLLLAVVLGVTGASPGKRAAGLRVVHHGTGTPVGVGRSLARALVVAVCGIPTFGIGLATLAWTAVEDRGRQRRGYHDQLAHSVVVDVRPVAEIAADADDLQPRHIVNLTAMRLVPGPPVESVPVPPRTHTNEQSVRRQPLPHDVGPAVVPPAPQVGAMPDAQPFSVSAPPPAAHGQPAPTGPGAHPAQSVSRHTPPPGAAGPPAGPPAGRPAYEQAPSGPPRHASRAVPAGPSAVAARHASASSARWRVTFDDGETFVVSGLVLVGRRPEPRSGEAVTRLVPLTSADMSVSKTHAQFGPAPDGAIVVMDRGSTNGTVVVRGGMNRHLTPGRPTTLVDGDRVVFGDREMRLAREA